MRALYHASREGGTVVMLIKSPILERTVPLQWDAAPLSLHFTLQLQRTVVLGLRVLVICAPLWLIILAVLLLQQMLASWNLLSSSR